MRNKIQTVSIGISAYNEGKNIENILSDILKQNKTKWDLKEVLVYCDGCSDNTVENAKKLNNKLIKVVDNKDRRGKVFRVNQLCKDFQGDILVIFDADVNLADKNVINNLIKEFTNKNVMLVGGNTRPFLPNTFFEKSVYSTFLVFDEARKKIKNGNNIFGCTGACIAIRKTFAREINIPDVINEDDYIYFSCLKKGYEFKHASKAIVSYKLPNTLRDYLKQVFRSDPNAVVLNFKQYFGKLPKEEYKRSLPFYFQSTFKVFLKNPIGVIYMTLIKAVCLPLFPIISKRYELDWYTAKSTK